MRCPRRARRGMPAIGASRIRYGRGLALGTRRAGTVPYSARHDKAPSAGGHRPPDASHMRRLIKANSYHRGDAMTPTLPQLVQFFDDLAAAHRAAATCAERLREAVVGSSGANAVAP